jgi:predicted HTH transcriptional regulator
MKTRFKLFRVIIEKLKNENQEFFKKNNSPTEILEEIKKGESSKQEFKSTLRINLHTNEIDKKIEHATLKTLVAFFNTEGGILYIGVDDKKEIIGIAKDKFENDDKFLLHFSNLFKQKIGKKHIKLIDYEIFEVDNKNILRIECSPSKKPIFLKEGKEENFFIRVGPETSELKASELIDYVKKRFDKKNK